MTDTPAPGLSCPAPLDHSSHITMAHGGGGTVMHRLLDEVFFEELGGAGAAARHDAATLPGAGRLAFTTDSYVIQPLFFPGGDIGSLAVHGTVNDLAMAGARPQYLSAGFILEEGLPVDTLRAVVRSMARAAAAAGVTVVTGDTKVVDRRGGDGMFINTAGVGVVEHGLEVGPAAVRPGDAVIVSGDLGRHGIAIMAVREGIAFEAPIESDSAPVSAPVLDLLGAGVRVRCLRDLTRGGLASALNEIAAAAGLGIALEQTRIPVLEAVRGACELLGFDPLYVANEGRFVAFVDPDDTGRALDILGPHAQDTAPAHIGAVCGGAPRVTIESEIGAQRILDMLSGEQLPRIC